MSTEPPASADPVNPDVRLRRRRRRRRAAALATLIGLLVWPGLLDSELQKRLDSLRVLGPVAGQAGGGGPAGHRTPRHAGPRLARAPLPPNFGALREGAAGPLGAQVAPAQEVAQALTDPLSAELVSRGVDPFLPAVAGPGGGTPFAPPSFPPIQPPDPVIGGPGPSPGGPPTQPPDPVINPPVVNPPSQPPVVTPPDQPPVVPPEPPPIVSPPTTPPGGPGPGVPPVVPNPGPGVSCGADPCGGGGGGGGGGPPPVSGAPEPALWLQMVLGTGLAGAALRQRRAQRPATALAARSRA